MMETAISAGDTAPMSRPIGAWMRASAASVTPCALSRSTRRRMGLPRAERADIETVARQRVQQRRIVDLRIVGQRDEGGVAVDVERRQRLVRPFGDHLDVGKALGRGKRGARIDDRHVVAEELADRRQRLADMDGADDDEPRRRHIDGEEDPALAVSSMPLLPVRRCSASTARSGSLRDVGGLDQACCRLRDR